jgi:hypothetical protein
LSTKPVLYGEKLLVLLWIYNPSDAPQSVMTCAAIDYFWAREIAIFDSAGNRVLSRVEEERLAEKKRNPASFLPEVFACLRNFPITVPPYACFHGSFSNPQHDFARNLNEYYSLPPGRYSLAPMKERPEQITRTSIEQDVKLSISVLSH